MPGVARAQEAEATFAQGLVFVRAAVQGRFGTFLFDTGAAASALDAAFARALGIRLVRAQRVNGPGGPVRAARAEPVRIAVAGGPAATVAPVVADLSPQGAAMNVELAGIIGGDLLAGRVMRLDYAAQTLTFAEAGDSGADSDEGVPLRLGATPYVSAAVTVEGRRATGSFQVDTGSNLAVVLWRPFARRAFPGAVGEASTGLGIGGLEAARLARLDALEVAGRTLGPFRANLDDLTRPTDAPADYAGAIGGPAWRGLALTLDYARARLSAA